VCSRTLGTCVRCVGCVIDVAAGLTRQLLMIASGCMIRPLCIYGSIVD
jgi:hypothetical protein